MIKYVLPLCIYHSLQAGHNVPRSYDGDDNDDDDNDDNRIIRITMAIIMVVNIKNDRRHLRV